MIHVMLCYLIRSPLSIYTITFLSFTALAALNRRTTGSTMSVAEQLRDALSKNAVRVIDLFREWDEDADGIVSRKEFRKAMPLLGLEVPRAEIDALFDSWDNDGSGKITLAELNKKLRR